jgi:RNA polymerase sigma factor (sigma-70 family)
MADDDELARRVQAAAAGDQDAWNWLVDRFSRLVWSVIRANGLSQPDAADAFQLTWLRLLDRVGTIQEPSRLGGWLATTARNECRGIWRKSGRATPTDDEVLERVAGTAPAADVSSLTSARDAVLWQAFGRLTVRCQQVLRVLVAEAEDGPPQYAGAALALQMPVGSLGPTRRRCLDQLRQMLSAAGI